MSTSRTSSRQNDRTVSAEDRPGVASIIEAMEEARGALLADLRSLVLTLEGVEERTLYDGFCRAWTPAYYVDAKQLLHLHNFRSGLRATMFVGSNRLEPLILESDRVPLELRLQLAKSSGQRGSKQLKVTLSSDEDVATLLELAKLKRDCFQ